MKKTIYPVLILLSAITWSGTVKSKTTSNGSRSKMQASLYCGPRFEVDNFTNYTVTQVSVTNNTTGTNNTYTNPTFPVFIPEGSGGDFTITVRFSNQLPSGSIKVSDGASIIGCQLYDTRIASYDIFIGCGVYYIEITDVYGC